MKIRRKISAFLLAGAMIMAMANPVLAAENEPSIGNGTEDNPATATITKRLEFAEGITIPSTGMTFEFEVKKITDDAPDMKIENITYTKDDSLGTLTDGKYAIEKTSPITFGTFLHAGVYAYTVTEKANTYNAQTGEAVSYSDKTYTLRAKVVNGEAPYVETITAAEDNMKQDILRFTNTYTKTASLSIEKLTEGALADRTKDFEFKITFTKAGTSAAETFVGKIGDEEIITCKSGQETTFSLHHGEQLIFENLPAGTRYKVEEIGAADGYTPSVKVFENGVEHPLKEAVTEADGLTTEAEEENNCLVGEGTNSVTFTNTFHDVAMTGIVMKNLPFILLIAIGICALGVLAVSKKRRDVKR